MRTIGQKPPLGFLLQTSRLTLAVLHGGHSIGATNFPHLNFDYPVSVIDGGKAYIYC
jgi:hypothetical protein